MKMKGGRDRRRAAFAVFPLALLSFAAAARAPRGLPAVPNDARKSETIAAGVERIEIRRGDFTAEPGNDRWTINILILDPAKTRFELGLAMDEIVGAEPVRSLAVRHGAVAAVNGGYFRTTGLLRGEPAGMLALGGALLSEPAKGRPSLAVSNAGGRTRAAIAQVKTEAALIVLARGSYPRTSTAEPDPQAKPGAPPAVEDGSSCAIDGFNRDRAANDLIILTPEFHRTTLTDPSGMEAVVRGGRVVELRDNQGSSPIPPDGFVISARGAGRDWMRLSLKAGDRVAVKTAITADPPFPFQPEFMIGGGPRLLAAGAAVPLEAEAYPAGFSTTRHPRTAAGVRADGMIILVVVDGRQPKIGVGMTIGELAALMAELGCVEAINMDGGGSSTMVVRGKVVNSPSDAAGERPVSDGLLVFER